MSKLRKSVDSLGEEIRRISEGSPRASQIAGAVGLRRIAEVVNKPGGIRDLLIQGKIALIPGESGTPEDAELARRELQRLLSLIETSYALAGGKVEEQGRG